MQAFALVQLMEIERNLFSAIAIDTLKPGSARHPQNAVGRGSRVQGAGGYMDRLGKFSMQMTMENAGRREKDFKLGGDRKVFNSWKDWLTTNENESFMANERL